MAASGRIVQRAHGLVVTALVAVGGLAACGDTDDEPAGVPEATGTSAVTQPSTSAPTSSVQPSIPATEPPKGPPTSIVRPTVPATAATTIPAAVYEGVIVARSQAMEPPHDWWWVIDLAGGATIGGSGRVLVELAQDQVGCGEAMRHIDTFQLREGTSVSFELVDDAPGVRPEFWYTSDETFDAELAVRGRQFRVNCPAGTEEVAAELTAQRAIWEQAGVDTYEFTMSYYVFSGLYGDYRINVVDGETVRLVREDGSELDEMLADELPSTIDELFNRLERSVTADSFVAEYDSELGYPRSVLVDHMVNAVDDELEVRVTSLTPAAV